MSARLFLKLSALMREYDMDQRELGRIIGLTVDAVSNRFTGKTDWKLTEVWKILDYFGIAESELGEYFPRKGKSKVVRFKERKKAA